MLNLLVFDAVLHPPRSDENRGRRRGEQARGHRGRNYAYKSLLAVAPSEVAQPGLRLTEFESEHNGGD